MSPETAFDVLSKGFETIFILSPLAIAIIVSLLTIWTGWELVRTSAMMLGIGYVHYLLTYTVDFTNHPEMVFLKVALLLGAFCLIATAMKQRVKITEVQLQMTPSESQEEKSDVA